MAAMATDRVTKAATDIGEVVVVNVAAKEEPPSTAAPMTYGRVALSLDNCLLPEDRLECTPSSQDGLDRQSEVELRVLGCEKIQSAGILLKLPQVAMATGQVLFHRFFYSKSLIRYNYEVVAMGCVCLASKIEEAPRRVRDVVNVFHHIKQLKNSKQIQPMILDQNYLNLKNQVIKAERRVLKELGFCVHVKHPHKVIVMYLQVLECKNNQRLTQLSWNYMNDSLRTDVFLRYSPETIACACIYLSARKLQIPLPNRPPWYGIFRVDERDVRDICQIILKLYARPKSNVEKLEKTVEDLKKAQDAAKLKAKGLSSSNTPQGSGRFSPNSRSNSPRKNDNSSPSNATNKKDRDDGGGKGDSKGKRNADSPRISNKESNHHGSKQQHADDSPLSVRSRDRKSAGSSRSRSLSRTPTKRKRRTNAASASANIASSSPPPTSRGRKSGRSRSKSADRGSSKKHHRSKRSRRSRSTHSPSANAQLVPSLPLPPPPSHSSSHRNHKKSHHKDKLKYRSHSRDAGGNRTTYRSRSRSYDKYDHKSSSSSTATAAKGSSAGNAGSRKDRSRDNGHHRSRSHERSRR